jgi:hypothetical protein
VLAARARRAPVPSAIARPATEAAA